MRAISHCFTSGSVSVGRRTFATSTRQPLGLLLATLGSLVAGATTALVTNRLEPAAMALGLVLVAGGAVLWLCSDSRTRPAIRAGTFCVMALGCVLAVAGLTDWLDVSWWGRDADLVVGASLAASWSVVFGVWFAARLFAASPRVALGLVAGWSLFANVIVLPALASAALPPWLSTVVVALAQLPVLAWMILHARRTEAKVLGLPWRHACLFLIAVSGFALGLVHDDIDALSTVVLLGSAGISLFLVALLWIAGRWSLRRGFAQPGALLAMSAVPLILALGLSEPDSASNEDAFEFWWWLLSDALWSLFVAWAAWRHASRPRATWLAIVLFGCTAALLSLAQTQDPPIAPLTFGAAVVATGFLCIKRFRSGRPPTRSTREGARSLRQAAHAALAMGFAGAFLSAHALIEWLHEDASPSRAMAKMGLPTTWVVAQALRDEFLWPRSARLSWLTAENPDALLYENLPGTPDWWSYVSEAGRKDAFDSGTELTTSVSWIETRGRVFAAYVDGGSAAEVAGVRRGLELVKFRCPRADAKFWRARDVWLSADRCHNGSLEGVFRDEAGNELPITWAMSRKPTPDVSYSILHGGRAPVGYLSIRAFRFKDVELLTQAIEAFEKARVRYVVLDLRYNWGGSIPASHELANLLVGDGLQGRVFLTETRNEFNPDKNAQLRFEPRGVSLGLEAIAFLTSAQTCSASESLIQGLKPYLTVAVIGEGTCGKPVGFTPIETVDAEIWVVNLELRNARGVGHYYSGILPDCHVIEDLSIPLGDTRENLLAAALEYFETGSCRRRMADVDHHGAQHPS